MRGAVAAIVPAAGKGRRFGGSLAKPFTLVNGHPMLAYVLWRLQESRSIRWIILLVRTQDLSRASDLLRRYRITKALPPKSGGVCRADSVARGCAALPPEAKWVLIHDGARPCISTALLERCVVSARRYQAVALGVPASVTVKKVDSKFWVKQTLKRSELWLVQTPQVFRKEWLLESLYRGGNRLARFPDDAALVEEAGFPVRMVPGDPFNIKVTTREDLILAEAILRHRQDFRNQKTEVRNQKSEIRNY
ncbi:MAG: 2-C-methyl-D-erythritol 4-phosphate cytidylyltransferase [Candidatus Omnitrophica bacterium]|nr:2-C-methyl-D-erythritol 4-phosphate cytidylyltransferase [Candidatus Omnitrophota bacterium]